MTARPVPRRHWRSYGDDPLPTGKEAMDEPFSAFPSWFMRITCERCGKTTMINEAHATPASARCAAPRFPRQDAPRRLRREGREGGAADRRRRRQQPTGAEDRARAAIGVMVPTGAN